MIREEIESLALWFVVATALVIVLNLFLSVSGTTNLEHLTASINNPSSALIIFSSFGILAKLIDNIAVGMWLYQRANVCGYNRWLWGAFGLAGSLVGGALYLLSRYAEARPSNQSSKTDA